MRNLLPPGPAAHKPLRVPNMLPLTMHPHIHPKAHPPLAEVEGGDGHQHPQMPDMQSSVLYTFHALNIKKLLGYVLQIVQQLLQQTPHHPLHSHHSHHRNRNPSRSVHPLRYEQCQHRGQIWNYISSGAVDFDISGCALLLLVKLPDSEEGDASEGVRYDRS